MFFRKLTLEGFRNIKEEKSFAFEQGISLIYGNSRSGKSSLLKAIRLLILNTTDKSLEDYVNEDMEYFKASLEFEHEGIEYHTTFEYDLNSKKSSRTLSINRQTPITGASNVVEKLFEIYDPNLVKNALAIMQGSDSVLKATPSERLQLFKKIKNIDFSKQVNNIDAEIKSLEGTDLKSIEIEIEGLKNKSYHYMDVKPIPFSEKEKKEKEVELKKQEASLNDIESKKKALQEKITQINKTTSDIEANDLAIQKATKELEEAKGKTFVSKLKEYEASLSTQQEKLDSWPKEPIIDTSSYNNKLDKVKKELSELQKSLDSSKYTLTRIKKPEDSRDVFKESIADLKSRVIRETEVINSCKDGKCPTCGKSFESSDISTHEETIDKLTKELEEAQNSLTLENEKFAEYEKRLEERELIKQEKTNIEFSIQQKSNEISTLEASLASLIQDKTKEWETGKAEVKTQISYLENMIASEGDRLKDFEENKKSLITSKEEYLTSLKKTEFNLKDLFLSLSKEKESLEEVENFDLPSIEDKVNILKKLISEYNDSIYHNKQAKEFNAKVDKEKDADKVILEEKEEEKSNYLKKVNNLKSAKKILSKDFPNYVIQETITDTENMMNSFIEQVFTSPMDVSLRSTATSLKLEYGVGRKRDCANASGSESMMITTSFIHSLNKQLGLGTIFFDEVDSPLDQESVKELYDVIDKMNYNQIFVISHNEDMQNSILSRDDAKGFNMEEILND